MKKISEVRVELGHDHQLVRFQDWSGEWRGAYLQMPFTPDSQNSLSPSDEGAFSDEEFEEICAQIQAIWDLGFSNLEVSRASLAVGEKIEGVFNFFALYIAYSAGGTRHFLQKGGASEYYKVLYFEEARPELVARCDVFDRIVEKADEAYATFCLKI